MSLDESRVAELASLLEIEVEDARRALLETSGSFSAAIEFITSTASKLNPPESPRREIGLQYDPDYNAEIVGEEPPLRELSGCRELQALERGVPPTDFLLNLCQVAKERLQAKHGSGGAANLLFQANFSQPSWDNISVGEISLHSLPTPKSTITGLTDLPQREADIIRGKERIYCRLDCCGLRALLIDDDGNCLFRACAAQLYRGDSIGQEHARVRRHCVLQMREQTSLYAPLFCSPEEFTSYLSEMAKLGSWGDELAIRAIADFYSVTVHVITSHEDNWYLVYRPAKATHIGPSRHIFLTYIAPIHYNGIEIKPLEPADVRLHVRT